MGKSFSIGAKDLSISYPGSPRTISSEGLSFRIRQGELTLLLGPSGCGKSTFALALSGLIPGSLEAHLNGSLFIEDYVSADLEGEKASGVDPNELPKVGIVFQDPDSQMVTGTILDEVCFGLENYCVPPSQIELLAVAALQQVGLPTSSDFLRRDPLSLSGGERQRLAIACVLALDPALVVLDEPTANLDPLARRELHQLLPRLAKGKPSRAVVVIEHSLDGLLESADQVVVLNKDGNLAASGSPVEVFSDQIATVLGTGTALPTAIQIRQNLLGGSSRALTLDEVAAEIHSLGLDEVIPQTDSSLDLNEIAVEKQSSRSSERELLVVQDLGYAVGAMGGRSKKKRWGRGEEEKLDLLKEISFSVDEGSFCAIVGPNGAGKTTLIKLLGGLTRPTTGSIQINGMSPSEMNARELAQTIGFVFQNPEHQFVANTVADDLAHGLRVRGIASEMIDQKVDEMLERFHLSHARNSSPFTLSHGEKRRLSVGAALICGPQILLLDEPTYGQDHDGNRELMSLLMELREQGVTVIVVTHDLQLVADYAQQIVVLDGGKVIESDCVENLISRENLQIKSLIGTVPVAEFGGKVAAYCSSNSAKAWWQKLCRFEQLGQDSMVVKECG